VPLFDAGEAPRRSTSSLDDIGAASMLDLSHQRLAARSKTAIAVIALICGVLPGAVWVVSRVGGASLSFYPKLLIYLAPMLALPALLAFIVFSSIDSGVLLTKSSSVDRRSRPTAFVCYVIAIALFGLFLLGLAGMFVWQSLAQGFV
jgi:hypothetical protein